MSEKRGKLKQMKRDKGITLIALVITIIILIILAAIAINAVFGENGLILRAQEAKFKTEVSGIKDLVDIKILEIKAARQINDSSIPSLSDYLNGLNMPEYVGPDKLVIDGNQKLAYIDKGNPGEFSADQKRWLRDIKIYPAFDWRSFSRVARRGIHGTRGDILSYTSIRK